MSKHCDDCGCKVYDGRCLNCHEIEYIEDQYLEMGDLPPESVRKEAEESRKLRKKNNYE